MELQHGNRLWEATEDKEAEEATIAFDRRRRPWPPEALVEASLE